MGNFYDDQLSHMAHLMFFGESNESKDKKNIVIENKKYGADGKVYGIVKEGTKYYVKVTSKEKENLLESYDYVGGFNNRKEYEYSSFADAVKDMNMKLMSLNEDFGKRMPVNEAKKNTYEFMDESMTDMKEDIARYRQIIENIDQVYVNKKSGIGDRNIGVPEAPKTTEFDPKIGGPFEDNAKYEANRDNKENAKNFKGQGEPFEKDGKVTDSKLESDKAPADMAKGDKLGQPYTDAAQYVPDGAVANAHPKGGEVVRAVNEDKTSFEEENPDIDKDEYGQLSPEFAGLSADEILSQYDDEDEEGVPTDTDGEGNEIAGIDDMSGVGREDIVKSVVSEAVDTVLKKRGLDRISESAVAELLKEEGFDRDGDRMYKNDSDFRFKGPDYSETGGRKEIETGLSRYMAPEGKRTKNLHKNKETGEQEFYDERPGAPDYVNPERVEFDKESPNFGENKYGLNLNDDPHDDEDDFETRQGAWETTGDVSRKFQNHFLSKGLADILAAGGSIDGIDANKIASSFRHGVYTLQRAKNAAAQDLGISPRMIENFLSSNFSFGKESISDEDDKKQIYVDSLNKSGYRDAKVSKNCIITPDGELPLTRENLDQVKEEYGDVVIGPSLKAVGFMNQDGSDLSNEDLKAFVDDCLDWDGKWTEVLDAEEELMKETVKHLQDVENSEDYKVAASKDMKSVISQFYSLIEQFGALQSLVIIPMEALNKREEYDSIKKYGKVAGAEVDALRTFNPRNGGVSAKSALSEEATILHDFGKHPGYRKKPMAHPENVEDAPNGARDWNDDSAKSSEPFGKQIGSSEPYTQIVKAITKRVIETLAENQNKR